MQKKLRTSAVFVLLILLVASILLILNSRSRYHQYLEHQRQLASRTVTAAAGEIGLQIAELKRRAALFAREEMPWYYAPKWLLNVCASTLVNPLSIRDICQNGTVL